MRGKIVSTNPATGEVTIDHQAIPGFMDAMTMPYKLRDTRILSELHPGDLITADVLVSQTADGAVLSITSSSSARPSRTTGRRCSITFQSQGIRFRTSSWSMKTATPFIWHSSAARLCLLTFIYTRCPLPDFCPRVTHDFAVLEKSLRPQPRALRQNSSALRQLRSRWRYPGAPQSYGETYMGSMAPKAFAHWDFAVSSKAELHPMAQWFDVGLTNEPDGTITHTLSTTLIGPDGKVVRFYPGNEWTPQQVLADVAKLYPAASQTSQGKSQVIQ